MNRFYKNLFPYGYCKYFNILINIVDRYYIISKHLKLNGSKDLIFQITVRPIASGSYGNSVVKRSEAAPVAKAAMAIDFRAAPVRRQATPILVDQGIFLVYH